MKNRITMLDRNGDTVVEFEPADIRGVSQARELFNLAMSRGYFASEMAGQVGVVVRQFDPEAQDTLLIAPVYAG